MKSNNSTSLGRGLESKLYDSPRVIRKIDLESVSPILEGSVVDKATVRTMGQEVEEHDFSGEGFNHDWE